MIGATKANGRIKLPNPHPGQRHVLSHARRFNWLSAGRRWRKTTLAMSIVVEAAIRGGTYIWGAPTYDQVRIGMGEVKRALGAAGTINLSRMTYELPQTGGTIVFRSLDNPDNVRGYTADGVVMDEAAFIKGDAWIEVLRPMLVDTGGWAWGIGTPKGRNWFHQEFSKAQDHDDYMAWQIPTRGVKVVDGELVHDPHPLENPDVPFSEIVQMWRSMPERVFEQEILGIFHEDLGGVFHRVMECATALPLDGPVSGRSYVAGVDVADAADFTVISILDARTRDQVYIDRFNRIGYTALEDRIHAVYERWNVQTMVIEDNSIGQPVIDHLRGRGMSIVPFHTSAATKQPLIQALQSAFEHGTIKILPDPVQIGELQAYEGKRLAGGMSYSAPAGMHDDTVMALALAWHGVGKRPTPIPQQAEQTSRWTRF